MATWKEDTIQALKNLGGVAHRSKIHKEVARLRKGKLNPTWTQTIQRELETYSSDSDAWSSKLGGKEDLFYMAEGKGKGVWGLRNFEASSIRDVFIKICNEYPKAKKEKLKNHPLAKYIRNEVPEIIKKSAGNIISGYKVNPVKHAGNWSRAAWVNFMDPRVTTTAYNGYYPAYLFHEDGKKVLFELGQGTQYLRATYKKETASILKSRAIILRNKVEKEFYKYGFKPVTKQMAIGMDRTRDDWLISGAFGKMYYIKDLPEEKEILKDLSNMLKLYNLAIERGGISDDNVSKPIQTKTDFDEEIEALSGTEKKVLKTHKEGEYEVVKRNQPLINALKKKKNYTCEACGLYYKKIYGNFDEKKEFIEAHHIVPVHKMKVGEIKVKNENDVAILCANCHRMIHKYGCPPLNEFKEKVIIQYKEFLKNK